MGVADTSDEDAEKILALGMVRHNSKWVHGVCGFRCRGRNPLTSAQGSLHRLKEMS